MRRLSYLALILLLGLTSAPLHGIATGAVGRCTILLGDAADETIPKKLQQAMSELKYEDEIPEHLFKEYDSRTMGEAIAGWVAKREEVIHPPMGDTVKVDLIKDAQIMLHFKPEDSEGIWKTQYKNQHETGRSSGLFLPDARLRGEDKFTGLRMGKSPEALVVRPKSSVLNVSANVDLGVHLEEDVAGRYGSYVAVLKNQVKRRSLWVSGDSLGVSTFKFPEESQLMAARGSFYRGSLPATPRLRGSSYIESVIYGEITLRDVDHFIVFTDTAEELIHYGLPVFRAEKIYHHNRSHYLYTEILQAGSIPPEALPPKEWDKHGPALIRLQKEARQRKPSSVDALKDRTGLNRKRPAESPTSACDTHKRSRVHA